MNSTYGHHDLRWKPNLGENHRCCNLSLQYLFIEKTSYNVCWCRLIPVRGHPPAEGYDLLLFTSYHWKGATTPFLKASTLSTTADLVSSIFILDPPVSIRHTLSDSRFIYFLYTHQMSSVIQPEIYHRQIIFMGAS